MTAKYFVHLWDCNQNVLCISRFVTTKSLYISGIVTLKYFINFRDCGSKIELHCITFTLSSSLFENVIPLLQEVAQCILISMSNFYIKADLRII